ncbi:hypothetical protein D3C80_1114980 [compost metagenome]
MHTRQHDVVTAAHQWEVVPLLIPGHQLHHVPGNTLTQAQAQAAMALVGRVEIALQRRNDRGHGVEQAYEIDRDTARYCQQPGAVVVQQIRQMTHRRRTAAEADKVELDPLESCERMGVRPIPQLPGDTLQCLGDSRFDAGAPAPGGRGIRMILSALQGAHPLDITA